ncbi:MAG TPA: Gldg family protein [Anaerolineales bacterium]|nr:Gldg family protein [Anaerolineales bacterium]
MNPNWRRFAPLGLVLSLVAAIAAIGFYLVQNKFDLYVQVSLGLVVVGLALYAFLDPDRVRQLLTGRQARYGSNALVLSLAFVGIVVMVNYLVYQNSKRWDLTEDKQYTLAPETIGALESLQEPVTAKAFYTARLDTTTTKDLLEQYKYYSDNQFDYVFIDPESDPVAAEQASVTRDGTIVISMGERTEPVSMASEQEITGALVRLISPEDRVVYFLSGHGEYNPEDTGERSYSQVKKSLESKNYQVRTLNLLSTNQIPEDADVIIVPGPRKPVSQDEVNLLAQFLGSGGALVIMEEPTIMTEFGEAADPLADYLGQTWGILLGQDMVVDLTSNQPFAPYAAQYGNHVITQKLQQVSTQFPTVRSVRVDAQASNVSPVELVLTASQSWAETDLAGLETNDVTFDQATDIPGPVSLAVVAENFEHGGRLVVFGDADFAIDANFFAYANGDLLINSIDWAAGQEALISLTPKNSTQRLLMPPDRLTTQLMLLSIVFLLPGLALVWGIVVWVQRRRRG